MTTFIIVVDVVPPTPKIAVDSDPVEVHRVGQGEPEPEGFFTSGSGSGPGQKIVTRLYFFTMQ